MGETTKGSRGRGFSAPLCTVGVMVAVVMTTQPALGQSVDVAAAEALFNQGKELFEAGRYAEACAKFEESQRLDPSPGTLLNLARCNEAEGKTASAWSGFLAAKRAAQTAGRLPLAEEAERRASELEGKLSYLTVNVPRPVVGLKVYRDDVELTEASLGTGLPIDPGLHRILASASGYASWSVEVIMEDGVDRVVTIPELLPEPPAADPDEAPLGGAPNQPAAADTAPPPSPDRGPSQPRHSPVPTAPLVVGGLGLVVTGAGLAFGGLAQGAYDSALDQCATRRDCSEGALDARERAGDYAAVSTVLVPVGLAGVAAGAVLWAVHERGVRAAVVPVPGGAFARLGGRF